MASNGREKGAKCHGKGRKGSIELNKVIMLVLLFFVMILIIVWVQKSFDAASGPASKVGASVTKSGETVVIDTIKDIDK